MREIRDEHRATVNWLNHHFSDVYFFVFEIQLWQIEDSKYAPNLQLVVEPNTWERTVHQGGEQNLSSLAKLRLEYWTQVKEYGENKYPLMRFRNPKSQKYYGFSFGAGDLRITWNWQEEEDISYQVCELYIITNKEIYYKFLTL